MNKFEWTRRAFLAAATTASTVAITGIHRVNAAQVVPRKISPNEKINIRYGAAFIRHHPQKLFGEHNTEALGYYTDIFEPYNIKMDDKKLSYDEHSMVQHDLKNRMEGILFLNPWLKKIPSEPSVIGFIKYLLKREADSAYIRVH